MKFEFYEKEIITKVLMIKIDDKEIPVGLAINCLDDIENDPNKCFSYDLNLLGKLAGLGALSLKGNYFYTTDQTSKWLDIFYECWNEASKEKTKKRSNTNKVEIDYSISSIITKQLFPRLIGFCGKNNK